MATTIAALHGYQILFLGPKTPLEEIISCAAQVNASAVLISVSVTSEVRRCNKMLSDLLSLLPRHIDIVVGGGGMSFAIPGITSFNSLTDFSKWAEEKKLD
jgi:methanogenic corrinoid protein MtbC1